MGNGDEFAKWSVSILERSAKLWSRKSRSGRVTSTELWGGKADGGAASADFSDLRSMMVNLEDTKVVSKIVSIV